MKRILLVVAALSLAVALTSLVSSAVETQPPAAAPKLLTGEAQPPVAEMSTFEAKCSYAFGLQIGDLLRQVEVKPDLVAINRGVEDAFNNRTPVLSLPERGEAMSVVQRKLQAVRMKRLQDLSDKNMKETEEFLARNKKEKGVRTTPSGLQYILLREGTGPKATLKDEVTVHYRGTLIDGTVFDSSYERNSPTTFSVAGVIPGWTEAMQMMNKGSKYRLFIHPDLAYGAAGTGPIIGPNATLIFEVELLDIAPSAGPGR